MKLKISPFAEIDLEESIDFYNEKKDGLVIDFAKTIDETFNLMVLLPF